MNDACVVGGPPSVFRLLDATVPADRATWVTLWDRSPEADVFAHPAYVANDARLRSARAVAVHWSCGGAHVLYPFLIRDVSALSCWHPGIGLPASDIVGPYGYGGPAVWGDHNDETLAQFWGEFTEWATDIGVISEFVRFSLGRSDALDYPGVRREHSMNVVRRLDLDPDSMWMDYEAKVRKNVKKAQRSGVRIEVDTGGERLDEFLRIYAETMERRAASAAYSFPRSYFEHLINELRDGFRFFHALEGDRVVSTEMVLVSRHRVYSFLGGTDATAFELRPNDLLKHSIINWAMAEGKREFVLGGGFEPGDGIYRYKLSFAPAGATPFYTGSRIFDEARYHALVDRADALRSGNERRVGFFPAYR